MTRPAPLPARTTLLALGAALAVVAGAIWTSPTAAPKPTASAQDLSSLQHEVDAARAAAATRDAHVAELTAATAALSKRLRTVSAVPRAVVTHVRTHVHTVHVTVKVAKKYPKCSSFRYQQDAQAAYLRDLTDPYGLDGPPGGHNGTGLACAWLPSDPHRKASKATAPYVAPTPTAPTKSQIMAEPKVRFGLYTTQGPYSYSEMNLVTAMVGKRPDTAGFFLGWDQEFRPDAVVDAWRNNALPLLTWESHPNGPVTTRTTVDSDYALGKIIAGDYDAYIDRFAAGVKKLGLPLAIRLDHEMNGNWYAWSEDQKYNAKGQYVQMWRHVVDRFRADGADKYVIWLWAPTRVDDIGHKTLAPYYPGDAYVDWVGVDGYFRNKSPDATFTGTFGKTLTLLRGLTSKKIFLAELGATESGGHKQAWIESLFQSLPLNKDIIGFSWFNIAVTSGTGSSQLTNDWRIDSSGPSLLAFKAGIADPRYSNQPPWKPS